MKTGITTSGCARWEHFEHEADIGIRGYGATTEEAFEQAALALTAVITDPSTVRGVLPVSVECEERDLELLLAEWLNLVIYETTTRNMLFAGFRVSIHGGRLRAILSGEPVDRDRHHPAVEPKGATYTALEVARDPDGCWRAQCIIDV